MKKKILSISVGIAVAFFTMVFFAHATQAVTYYVDATGGNDSSAGTSSSAPWKTISKVNNSTFQPGDSVLFKRGDIWREQLNIPSSGTAGNPITFSAYGSGVNPVLYRSTSFGNWTQVASSGTSKVWKGSISGNSNYWGLYRNGNRALGYYEGDGTQISGMSDGYFLSTGGSFYFRNDAGNPGTAEVGTRENAINSKGKSYITIDSIDCFGPGGSVNGIGDYKSQSAIIFLDGATGWTIKNLKVSYTNRWGIYVKYTSSNIAIDNVDVSNTADTGIYHNASGSITNSKIHDVALLESDAGDRGGIGVGRTEDDGAEAVGNLTMDGNEIYNIARNDRDADFAIAMADVAHPVIITRNYIHDIPAGCIEFANMADGGTSNSVVAYNIINGYGESSVTDLGHGSAVRIGGGGNGPARGIKIFNNIFTGGRHNSINPDPDYGWPTEAAIHVECDASNLQVENNIFYNNLSRDIYVHYGASISGAVFNNNVYSRPSYTDDWWIQGDSLNSLTDWKSRYSQDSSSLTSDPSFINIGGSYSQAMDFKLSSGSPAINAGANVGLTSDYAGNTVPQGAAPDIGAYEYTSGTTPPPTYSKADLNQDGSVNATDFGIIKTDFFKLVANLLNPRSDIDADGQVTAKDVGIMMSAWK